MLIRPTVKNQIIALLRRENPPPIADIIHQFAVEQRVASAATVRTYTYQALQDLVKEGHKISLPKKRTGEKRHEEIEPISDVHRAIGYRLNYYRDITEGKTPNQFCALYDYFSPRILRKMELGAWDFTLTDLTVIAETVGMSIPELTAPLNPEASCQSSKPKIFSDTYR